MEIKIYAIIVLYNPDMLLLKRNVESIYGQVNEIFLYDNASMNFQEISAFSKGLKNIQLIKSENNNGIAKAVNDCVKLMDDNCEWFLTLDQDSVCPSNMIAEYSKYINLPKLAMIAPRVHTSIDREIQCRHSKDDIEYIHCCITSASFVKREAFYSIGGMDEQMVIDQVDHDLCKHFEITGWKIIQCNNVILEHNLGSKEPVQLSITLNKYLHTKIIYQTYSPFRIYHLIRNTIYYMRKYGHFLTINEKKDCIRLILQHVILKSLIVGKEKCKILNAIFSAVRAGFKMKVDLTRPFI